MTRYVKKVSDKAGLPPGTAVHIGERKPGRVRVRVLDYDRDQATEHEIHDIREVFRFRDTPSVSWISIDGLHDIRLIEQLGAHFGFHPLFLEDIVNTASRPKIEDFESYVFIVFKMLSEDRYDGRKIVSEHVSLIFSERYVISFQEREGDMFDSIRQRIISAAGSLRKKGADYLAYRLMDAVVDNYFALIESIGEQVDDTEDLLLNRPEKDTIHVIHRLKSENLFLHKFIFPLRDILSYLERGESDLVKHETGVYFRDVYDHTIQIMDNIETLRDVLSGMMDIYLSSMSNRMNEVMKVLTVFASLFIPLTFLVGVYGMNFDYMPELHWRWAYPVLWIVMVGMGVCLLVFFRKKKWL
ncbi:MAG: magnesium/cobalt transporter CorA [Deltaproteobacteria bacterium]|nr:magnesium/cobalt transporter CorA [Deltaproteobacteria bacterium]